MSKKKTAADYEALAQAAGIGWSGEYPAGVMVKTVWICSCGAKIHRKYNQIQNQIKRKKLVACRTCTGTILPTEESYRELARVRRVEWVGSLPKRTTIKTTWKCRAGHEFNRSYHSMQKVKNDGNGCQVCSRKARKTIEDYVQLGNSLGLTFLADVVPENVFAKAEWQCRHGHPPFPAHYNELCKAVFGCPVCSGNAPKTVEDYRSIGDDRPLEWIGKRIPKNTARKTRWRCKECGHEWPAAFNNVVHNESGCPECVDMVNGRRVSKPQRKICDFVGGTLNVMVNGYCVDVVVFRDEVPIAIEYDSWFFHGGRETDDRLRNQSLLRAGYRVLEIKSNSRVPSKKQLAAAIADLVCGKQLTQVRLSDWGDGNVRSSGTERRFKRRSSDIAGNQEVSATEPDITGIVGELDERRLFLRRDDVDIAEFSLPPQEHTLLRWAIAEKANIGNEETSCLRLSTNDVRTALANTELPETAIRTLLSRMRKKFRVPTAPDCELFSGMTKGFYCFRIPVWLRPPERQSTAIVTSHGRWRSFAEARSFSRSLGLKTQVEWNRYAKSGLRPHDIPSNPQRNYRDDGWVDWPDWLGDHRWRPFEEARKFVRALNLGTQEEWKVWARRDSGFRPEDIPACPWSVYAEWRGIENWLGTEFEFRPFKAARAFVRSLGLKNREEWRRWRKTGIAGKPKRPRDIPTNPNVVYKNSGWKGDKDWLGVS